MKALLFRCTFTLMCFTISVFLLFSFLGPIFTTQSLIIPYGLHPFDICLEYPVFWKYLKLFYFITYILSVLIVSNALYLTFFNHLSFFKKSSENFIKTNELYLSVGKQLHTFDSVFLPHS